MNLFHFFRCTLTALQWNTPIGRTKDQAVGIIYNLVLPILQNLHYLPRVIDYLPDYVLIKLWDRSKGEQGVRFELSI